MIIIIHHNHYYYYFAIIIIIHHHIHHYTSSYITTLITTSGLASADKIIVGYNKTIGRQDFGGADEVVSYKLTHICCFYRLLTTTIGVYILYPIISIIVIR